jgi:hypothetical protein
MATDFTDCAEKITVVAVRRSDSEIAFVGCQLKLAFGRRDGPAHTLPFVGLRERVSRGDWHTHGVEDLELQYAPRIKRNGRSAECSRGRANQNACIMPTGRSTYASRPCLLDVEVDYLIDVARSRGRTLVENDGKLSSLLRMDGVHDDQQSEKCRVSSAWQASVPNRRIRQQVVDLP